MVILITGASHTSGQWREPDTCTSQASSVPKASFQIKDDEYRTLLNNFSK